MRKLPLSVFLLAPLVALGLYACDQGSPAEPVSDEEGRDILTSHSPNDNPFAGAWRMTSAILGNDELLEGEQYIMTFRGDGTHSVTVVYDTRHLVCPEPHTSCSWDGTYTYTRTTLTTVEPNHPDPGEQGEDTSSYTFCGGKLIAMDHGGEGDGVRLTFQRTGLGR